MNRGEQAESIREHVRSKHIEPARRRGDMTVTIAVGDIRREIGLRYDQVPAICGALRAKKFLIADQLIIEKIEGPRAQQSSTTKFTYRMLDAPLGAATAPSLLLRLRGIGKDLFRSLGGAEAFIRRERDRFYRSGE